MKSKHLKLEWYSSDGNYISHRSALGSSGVSVEPDGAVRWSSYSAIHATIGDYMSHGVCKTILEAQRNAENHLIKKATAKKTFIKTY